MAPPRQGRQRSVRTAGPLRSRIVFGKSPTASAPRRAPAVQRRGRERRGAILDAAEALLREQGYEAATLKAIGERAGIPTAPSTTTSPTGMRSTPNSCGTMRARGTCSSALR
ncbi:helix-turn-helix domain-containing protein [Streptomyces sp. NK08204]|uniref:TetR/AcrR family transcriptional regulator n=1 Tax=Streptomyces sp. NK08204 TaxID=2873260 RepID=UPI001CECEAF2